MNENNQQLIDLIIKKLSDSCRIFVGFQRYLTTIRQQSDKNPTIFILILNESDQLMND